MVILKHRLRLMQHDGERFVEIVVHRPEPEDRSWTCDYAIAWPEGVWRSRGAGHDALQALVLTLQKIGTEIYVTPTTPRANSASKALKAGMASRSHRACETCSWAQTRNRSKRPSFSVTSRIPQRPGPRRGRFLRSPRPRAAQSKEPPCRLFSKAP